MLIIEARKSMRRSSTSSMKAKGQFPSDKETLQDSVELIFGSDIDKMKEMASKMRTRFFQAAIAGAVGSIIFYYLLLNHHI
tara:strand:- start:104 stop:346 length:243 start_codon:yes stop_codon:yes gene_type:complete